MNDFLKLKGAIKLERFDEAGTLAEILEKDNLIVQVGLNFVASALIASSTSPFNAVAAGSSGTAAALSDTALGAELGRVSGSNLVTSTAAGVTTFVATFNPGTATGAWQEAGIFNNTSSGGTMLSHIVFSTVTKGSGDTIVITWTVTV